MSYTEIPGWFDFEPEYDRAVQEAREGAVLVEVGTAYGKSIAYLARKAIESGKKDLRVIAVDSWDEAGLGWDRARWQKWGSPYEAFVSMMRYHVPEEYAYIRALQGKSVEVAQQFAPASVDFCFIDAGHDYDDVRSDIEAWRSRVRPGGVIAGHDHFDQFPGVARAVKEAFGSDYELRHVTWWKRL